MGFLKHGINKFFGSMLFFVVTHIGKCNVLKVAFETSLSNKPCLLPFRNYYYFALPTTESRKRGMVEWKYVKALHKPSA